MGLVCYEVNRLTLPIPQKAPFLTPFSWVTTSYLLIPPQMANTSLSPHSQQLFCVLVQWESRHFHHRVYTCTCAHLLCLQDFYQESVFPSSKCQLLDFCTGFPLLTHRWFSSNSFSPAASVCPSLWSFSSAHRLFCLKMAGTFLKNLHLFFSSWEDALPQDSHMTFFLSSQVLPQMVPLRDAFSGPPKTATPLGRDIP